MTWTFRKKATVTAIPIVAVVVTLLMLGSQASSVTTFTVTIPTTTYRMGDTVNISILLSPTRPVKAWETKVTFTKTVLNAKTVSEGSFFKPAPTFYNAGVINNQTGEITSIYDLIIGPGNVSASKPIINISFKAIRYGMCYINLTGTGATNETMYIPITVVNATVFIYSPYDMNADKTVGMTDLLDVAGHYGQTGPGGWIKEDIDKNGRVGLLDLVFIATHWGAY